MLTQLAADAGTPAGEAVSDVDIAVIVDDAIAELGAGAGCVTVDARATRTLRIPRRAFTQAMRGLLKNAIEAGAAHVAVVVVDGDNSVVVRVDDDGPGFVADVAARVGEPFVTTKAPGAGMGLGLFLTRTLVERFGGTLEVGRADVAGGARVTIVLPAEISA